MARPSDNDTYMTVGDGRIEGGSDYMEIDSDGALDTVYQQVGSASGVNLGGDLGGESDTDEGIEDEPIYMDVLEAIGDVPVNVALVDEAKESLEGVAKGEFTPDARDVTRHLSDLGNNEWTDFSCQVLSGVAGSIYGRDLPDPEKSAAFKELCGRFCSAMEGAGNSGLDRVEAAANFLADVSASRTLPSVVKEEAQDLQEEMQGNILDIVEESVQNSQSGNSSSKGFSDLSLDDGVFNFLVELLKLLVKREMQGIVNICNGIVRGVQNDVKLVSGAAKGGVDFARRSFGEFAGGPGVSGYDELVNDGESLEQGPNRRSDGYRLFSDGDFKREGSDPLKAVSGEEAPNRRSDGYHIYSDGDFKREGSDPLKDLSSSLQADISNIARGLQDLVGDEGIGMDEEVTPVTSFNGEVKEVTNSNPLADWGMEQDKTMIPREGGISQEQMNAMFGEVSSDLPEGPRMTVEEAVANNGEGPMKAGLFNGEKGAESSKGGKWTDRVTSSGNGILRDPSSKGSGNRVRFAEQVAASQGDEGVDVGR